MNVVTHQVELMAGITADGMDSQLRRGQRENQPAAARVNRGQTEHVPEERAHLVSPGENTIACTPVITARF